MNGDHTFRESASTEWHLRPLFTLSHIAVTLVFAVSMIPTMITIVANNVVLRTQTESNTTGIAANTRAIQELVKAISEKGYISPEADVRLKVIEKELALRDKSEVEWRAEVRQEFRDLKSELRKR